MVTVLGVAIVRNCAVRVLDAAVRQMGMIVVMSVDGKRSNSARSKELRIFLAVCHSFRRAGTAHMTVQADNLISCSHHNVEIVRHQQDATAALITNLRDELINTIAT